MLCDKKMCQEKVIKLLKKSKRGMTVEQMIKKLKLSRSAIQANLKALTKFKEIQRNPKPNYLYLSYIYKIK